MPPSDVAGPTLNDLLLEAHARDDRPALIALYLEAGNTAQADEAAGFYLTHAYVFALEAGDLRAPDIKARLVAMGRER
jgi:hypothetical protein